MPPTSCRFEFLPWLHKMHYDCGNVSKINPLLPRLIWSCCFIPAVNNLTKTPRTGREVEEQFPGTGQIFLNWGLLPVVVLTWSSLCVNNQNEADSFPR